MWDAFITLMINSLLFIYNLIGQNFGDRATADASHVGTAGCPGRFHHACFTQSLHAMYSDVGYAGTIALCKRKGWEGKGSKAKRGESSPDMTQELATFHYDASAGNSSILNGIANTG